MLLCFSFTGENTTGEASFTIADTIKFNDLFLDDVKFQMSGSHLHELISKTTSGIGSTESDTAIVSPLYIKMDFLDNKDVKLYSLSDAVNNTSDQADSSDTLNTAQNYEGMIPIGFPKMQGSGIYASAVTFPQLTAGSLHLIRNRPQTWSAGKVIKFTLYNRNIETDGLIKDINKISVNGPSGGTAFGDECNVDIILRLE
jgi:hypothetical protein